MEKQMLDFTLVPGGLLLMLGYHIWLLFRILKHPNKTVIGLNSLCRRYWVRAMMEDVSKNGVLSVQTMRNSIMAPSVLASACIMLCSAIAVFMSGKYGDRSLGIVFGDKTPLSISIKCFAILVCFLTSFFMNVQSIRYFSLASILINVPLKKIPPHHHHSHNHLTVEYVGSVVNTGSYCWSLAQRAFYFSFPLFLWIFGPIPMFFSCIFLLLMLYLVDIRFQSGWPLGLSGLDEIHPATEDGGALTV